MGAGNASKTLGYTQFGDTRDAPHRTYAVLRTWVLHRMRQNSFLHRPARGCVFEQECEQLRRYITETGAGEHPAARAKLQEWAPQCL